MDSQPTDKVEGVGDDFVRGGQDQTPIKQKRKRIVVNAGTPNVTVTEGNEQSCAPWTAESPGATVTTVVYNEDEKKRCLSAEGGSGDPRKKVFLNKTKPSRGLIAKDIASAKTRSARKPKSVKRRCAARPVRR